MALNYPPKRNLRFINSRLTVPVDVVAALSATTTIPVKLADGPFDVTQVEICVPGGFAADPTNYWVITLVDAASSAVLATWSTLTGQQGALTANLQEMLLTVPATGLAGDQLNLVFTKHASAANLPAQTRVVVHTDESC